jgi:hypothetical protein
MNLNETLSLSKALAIKNRLAGRLAQAKSNIETYNSVLAGQVDATGRANVDVRGEYERFLTLQKALVTVKGTIQRANVSVIEPILELAELKARLQMLGHLNTKHGSEPGYGGIEFRYVATLTKPEVQAMTKTLESEIDRIQDRLNAYNATTTVELPTSVLDLAR